MLSLTCVLLVIRQRCLASPFAVFQSSVHSFLIVCLIRLTLAVFSNLCLKGVAFMPLHSFVLITLAFRHCLRRATTYNNCYYFLLFSHPLLPLPACFLSSVLVHFLIL